MTPALIRRLRASLDGLDPSGARTWSEAEAWALATELERRGLMVVRREGSAMIVEDLVEDVFGVRLVGRAAFESADGYA